jgi:excisionase family DNA binding protein
MIESPPTPPFPTGQSVNRREAAALLACSLQAVTRLIRAGRLKATDIGLGRLRHYRISLADLRQFQAGSVAPAPDAPVMHTRRSARRPTVVVPNLV